MARPEAPLPPAPAASSGPGEYTRMFNASSLPEPAPSANPPAAGVAATQKKSWLPLILILAGLFLLVLIVIVVFAFKK